MSRLNPIYCMEQLPVFQNRMFATAASAERCTRGDVALVQDLETGLIFNQAFDPELMVYDGDYQNEQGHSGVFRAHLDAVSQLIMRHFGELSLIEVGCGKAHFLEQLQGLGFEITGLDPTYEGSNPAVRREYFTPATGLRADALILRHVLEHVQDPVAFLGQLRDSNGGHGKIYIEVPCVDWIADNRAWFDIFYEHVNYFRLDDFSRMFATVHEAGRAFGGQYLYAVADLATLRMPALGEARAFTLPGDFRASLDIAVERLRSQGKTRQSAIWGGASKGVIFALLLERAGVLVDMVVDINPAKQGRHLAATGLRVHAAEEAIRQLAPGSDVYVMNRNYLTEIQALTDNRFNYIKVEHEEL